MLKYNFEQRMYNAVADVICIDIPGTQFMWLINHRTDVELYSVHTGVKKRFIYKTDDYSIPNRVILVYKSDEIATPLHITSIK